LEIIVDKRTTNIQLSVSKVRIPLRQGQTCIFLLLVSYVCR